MTGRGPHSMSAFRESLTRLFFPPKCVACGSLLEPPLDVFCPVCLSEYERSKMLSCAQCLKPFGECSCSCDFLRSHGVSHLYKVFGYRAGEGDAPANKLIFSLKNDNFRTTYRFAAREWEQVLKHHNIPCDDAIVTYIPSSRRRLMMSGFDHGRQMAKALASRIGSVVLPTLVCSPSARKTMQKEMTHDQRLSRAGTLFAAKKKTVVPKGKNIILIDDISTSGATLYSAVSVLRGIGARRVYCLVLGETIRPYHNAQTPSHKK